MYLKVLMPPFHFLGLAITYSSLKIICKLLYTSKNKIPNICMYPYLSIIACSSSTFATFELATGISDNERRLQDLNDQFVRLKQSSVPAYNYVITFLAGMLPNPAMSFVLEGAPTSILLSTIPGPNRPLDIFDHPLTQSPTFEGGYGKGPVGMGVAFLSCGESLSITVSPDEGVIPSLEDAKKLLECIISEIQLIHDSSVV